MPTFCRHGRFVQNCGICSRAEKAEPKPARAPSSRGGGTTARRSAPRSSGVVVRRVARAVEDGYESELVPGLKASGAARRLADELAFSTARLAQLAADPPGLYAEAALEGDREEATWLAFLIAYVSPAGGEDAFAGVRAARRPWAGGEPPELDGATLGPRTSHEPARGQRTVHAYRAWAQRAGSQAAAFGGDPAWSPERRFDRVFERLALPGFGRPGRYELLVSLGRLGLYELTAGQVHLEGHDDATLAAKRIFGIGERFHLERRARDLAEAAEVPLEALDLALFNFGRPEGERATMGAAVEPDPAVRERIEAALGLDD